MKLIIVKKENTFDLLIADGTLKTNLTLEDVRENLLNFTTISDENVNETFQKKMDHYTGEIVFTIRDDGTLEIPDITFMQSLLIPDTFPYYTVNEFMDLTGRGKSIIQRVCRKGRIQGAVKTGNAWFIPKGVNYPFDNRLKEARDKKNNSED